jgi:hypothetical protein
MVTQNGSSGLIESYYSNTPDSFDPTAIDFITMQVKEAGVTKGKATANTNEADASGGDELLDRIDRLLG